MEIHDLIRAICAREGIAVDTLRPLSGGMVNQVCVVNERCVVRVGAREDAQARLRAESELLRGLAGRLPVPAILAFGRWQGHTYQIQSLMPGEKLYRVWDALSPRAQEQVVAEFAACRRALTAERFSDYGLVCEPQARCATWEESFAARLESTLAEIAALKIHMAPGFLELAGEYFAANRHTLAGDLSTLVHGDLWLGNVLVEDGHISALLDFEFALHAPPDYELHILEAFCLYPQDYAEEDPTSPREYTAAEFAGFFRLLRKHDPELFATPHLRERVNLYHLHATLHSTLEWRKSQQARLPFEQPAARGFYAARIANFTSNHAIRLF